MAKGKKTGGKNFEKGHQVNKGKDKLTAEDKKARQLTRVEFMRIANKYMGCNLQELTSSLKDPTTPVLHLIVIKLLVLAVDKGDQHRLEFVLNHTLGKLPDKLDITNPDGSLTKTGPVMVLPSNGKELVSK